MTFAEFLVRALGFGIYDLFDTGLFHGVMGLNTMGDTPRAVTIGLGMLACVVVSYLLGSVNFALIISKAFFRDDVREHGSGNAGTTNVLRTYGKKAAILTFVGDALKGILSVLFACALFGVSSAYMDYLYLVTAVYLAGFFCVLGHVFPLFAHFRGGKGFATMVGLMIVLNPAVFVILFILYVPLLLGTHYISLCSVLMALFWPLFLSLIDRVITGYGIHVLFVVAIGMLIAWAHRGNLQRIYEGTERKFYPFGKKEPVASTKSTESDGEEEA